MDWGQTDEISNIPVAISATVESHTRYLMAQNL